jgi:hypothetical protein
LRQKNERNRRAIPPTGFSCEVSLNLLVQKWGVSTQIDFALKCR